MLNPHQPFLHNPLARLARARGLAAPLHAPVICELQECEGPLAQSLTSVSVNTSHRQAAHLGSDGLGVDIVRGSSRCEAGWLPGTAHHLRSEEKYCEITFSDIENIKRSCRGGKLRVTGQI